MKSLIRDHLKFVEMNCAANDSVAEYFDEVASVYHTLDRNKQPWGE